LTTNGSYLGRLWVLMATVFVDMIGFFIVLPLLPFYAEKLGAGCRIATAAARRSSPVC
jgi:hypothetical protein